MRQMQASKCRLGPCVLGHALFYVRARFSCPAGRAPKMEVFRLPVHAPAWGTRDCTMLMVFVNDLRQVLGSKATNWVAAGVRIGMMLLSSIVVCALSVSRLRPLCMHVFSRHTRFGGTLQVGGGKGLNARIVANPFKDRVDCVPQATRQKNKIGKTFTAVGVSGDSQGSSQR